MPRVFLSYSHEDHVHDQWVMYLGKLLREKGVDAYLDKWDLIPGQDTTYFMESQIRDSDFVILICTPLFAEKSNIPRGGVGYEKNIISAEMLQASDLRPKFIPILRKGSFDNALPAYLGSKYAIDFRENQNQNSAIDELLRAIYKQPHPDKPPLGQNPFSKAENISAVSSVQAELPISEIEMIQQDQDIHLWEKEALGRFEYLCKARLNKQKENPFSAGFWQASFVLLSKPNVTSLNTFLEKLRASITGRTGWDIGWVPNRSGIAPYPYQSGIEVWLAEDGDKGPGYSDFWRAELSGRFALFRGYQEDETDFRQRLNLQQVRIVDFSIFLWRVSEFLLYLENFSKQMSVKDSRAILKITWKSLENRRIGYHKGFSNRLYEEYICHQDMVSSIYNIASCADIKKNLIRDVHAITLPLFESFNFFTISEDQIKDHIAELFNPEKEGV